ncbi:MAG: tripartite tricarboxylate transporter TctB family protein [Rhizobiales bacterium]|nr:tripartite tricarboxylate transporter TctB family protein [Hyphomicrobiales bacterium]
MSSEIDQDVPKSVKSIWPAVILLVFAIAAYVIAQDYSEVSRRFPSLVAATMVVLALIDLYSRSGLPGQKLVNSFWGSDFERREMSHNPPVRDEVKLFAWLGLAFFGMAIFGILAAAPVFTFLFTRFRTERSLSQSALAGFVVLAFEYSVFEWALHYQLYRGLILTGEGFSAW